MDILLNDLLKMPCFNDAILRTGGLKSKRTIIKGITIMERPDISNWIKGGEILLTTFYSVKDDLNSILTIVKELVKKDAAALIIKTSKNSHSIPIEIIELGELLDFPIIEIPENTKFIDIIYSVMGEIINGKVNKLNYYKNCHEKFIKQALKMGGMRSIASTLEELVGNPVIILDDELKLLAYSHEEYDDIDIIDKKMINSVEDGPVYILYIILKNDDKNIYSVIMKPIKEFNNTKVFLGVIEKNRTLNGMDSIAIESAATTLKLEILKERIVIDTELKYKDDLMDELIHGKFNSLKDIYDRGTLFGWNLNRRFVVLIININQYKGYLDSVNNINERLITLNKKLNSTIKRTLYNFVSDYISVNRGSDTIILWPLGEFEDIKYTYKKTKEFGYELQNSILEIMGNVLVSIGIGGLAENPVRISNSYSEAKDALNFGHKIIGKDSIKVYEELGIYKLLCSYENREDLMKFVPQPLIELKEYDKKKNGTLIETLETYLACNLNSTKTAEELFVHYKTVNYRLNKIREITNLDISERGKILEIEVGLKILRIIE